MLTSVSTVCRMLNILPMTLKGWQAALLISSPHEKGYSEPQVAQIRVVRVLTSSGDTLSDIYSVKRFLALPAQRLGSSPTGIYSAT
ncbi:MerR family transcriptional regulator [Franconibacter pulveris 601]|uniref:MerR family transcriptional regulator n=1 Tax=Franconibacter pulveris TaxID=435910 RepID=UPI001267A7D6